VKNTGCEGTVYWHKLNLPSTSSTCHHGMVHPQVADREDSFRMWKTGVNILNKQLWTADKVVLQLGSWTRD